MVIAVVAVSGACLGGTYYVSPSGTSGSAGTISAPWSMSYANSTLVAGDTAILMDGQYTNYIAPVNSGSNGAPITFIAQNALQAKFGGLQYGAFLTGKSWIVLDGIQCNAPTSRWVLSESGSSHLTITNCHFENSSGWESIRLRQTGGYIRVTNNYIYMGTDSVHIRQSVGHYVAGNTFVRAEHTPLTLMNVTNSVVENNSFTNVGEKLMEVFSERFYLPPNPLKSQYDLIQKNWFGSGDIEGIQYAGNYSIVRRNIFSSCIAAMALGQYGGTDPTDDPESWWDAHNRFYNNTLYSCTPAINAACLARLIPLGGEYADNICTNNIIYGGMTGGQNQVAFDWDANPSMVQFYYNSIRRSSAGGNVFWWGDKPDTNKYYTIAQMQAAYPAQYAHNMDFFPSFVNAGIDFHLNAGSPCIDAGGPLTTATGSGSGTVVPVADPLYFTNGYGVVAPDVIKVGSQRVTIVSVDYNAKLLTVDQSVTWTNGMSVYADFNGAGPDLGAYETGGAASVVARQLFYNGSAFDGDGLAVSAADDNAIATDKAALLPGHTAGFQNYSSYSNGLNGIMIDIANLGGAVTAADFQIQVGNSSTPSSWSAGAAPTVTVRNGAGTGGSARVELTWANNAIQNQWVQVTVLANGNTGLSSPDVFYFGNAIGETGNSGEDGRVSPADQIAVRNDPHTAGNPAAIDNAHDFNRDKLVGPTDEIITRNQGNSSATALQLILVP